MNSYKYTVNYNAVHSRGDALCSPSCSSIVGAIPRARPRKKDKYCMSDTSLEQTKSLDSINTDAADSGDLRLEEGAITTSAVMPVPTAELEAKIAAPRQAQNRAGTVEHLAARRTVTPIDTTSAEVKEQLSDLRSTITSLVTGFRWGGISLEE